ncbi:MAG: FMN phosphatase YigB (HAD superfamily) [Myxococcota bacterium]|jgi:FMN phosphatase YigB (HAD superfamily)
MAKGPLLLGSLFVAAKFDRNQSPNTDVAANVTRVTDVMDNTGPVRAIVFDLFDTLVDLYTEKLPRIEYRGHLIPASARALHATLPHRSGIDFDTFATAMAEVDDEFKKSHYSEGLELSSNARFAELCDRLAVSDPKLPGVMAHVHMGLLREQVAMPLHHLGILCSLSERVQLGLCSNFSHTVTACAILEDYGIHEYLDAIVISEEVGIRKPRSEIFIATLDELTVATHEVLHVGDNLGADVAGAAALGIRSVWITRRVKDPEKTLAEFDGPRPDFQIEDLAELEGILDQVQQA